MKSCDIAVIGAGPAGLAAATRAADLGYDTVLLDEQPSPGGQIYRAVETADHARTEVMGADYARGRAIVDAFRASGAAYMDGALVWNISTDRVIDFSRGGASSQLSAKRIIVATGAVERPWPLPGWTLPGVTTAGALQILMKASGIVQEDAVLAGSGPLLWLVAAQLVDAGAPPRAVVETTPRAHYRAALAQLPAALRAPGYLAKGWRMMRKVKRAGVRHFAGAENIAIEGADAASAIRFTAKGASERIEASSIALHQGVVPNQQITRLLRCDHAWDAAQQCFRPVTDEDGQSSVQEVYVAGDGAGIGGALSAALHGEITALAIAARDGRGDPARLKSLRAERARDAAVRPFLETLYAPAPHVTAPADDTIVCRCEEVTAGAIREAVNLGAPGPNQVKSFLRAGMGPCQGRVCGPVVSAIIAERRGETPGATGYYRIRPPLKPIPLSELAQFTIPDAPEDR
ncbi:FAD-dependent oxidoreductase [Roseovarius spongiae]|uniref:FAD-dependent oxidoreductase n=1 Tax=Roseovarius spongiae TaxID=2320272 RepID=A0A3A8AVE1_9RHOB|nr:NAD(P)/FAD-dependent oxidoreductase [Roseovarius spongiae]RKF14163.1 FAD-dependent oxidoreductase [Roseovarius spongiae]